MKNDDDAIARTLRLNRRSLLKAGGAGLAGVALEAMLRQAGGGGVAHAAVPGTDFPAKAKRAIWLFMAGGPSQLDLFDYKPDLTQWYGKPLPDSVRGTQRLTKDLAARGTLYVSPSMFRFSQSGQSGTWFSELVPNIARLADDIAVIKTVNTEAVNHDPAMLAMMTGSQLAGKPSAASWLSYGLGSMNADLPTFVVMTSTFADHSQVQALSERLWGNFFLPASTAGVTLRTPGTPVLYLADPPGMTRGDRRAVLDTTKAMNQRRLQRFGQAETSARIDQYEMAFRMQSAVPALTDLAGESESTRALYGPEVNTPGTFAANCLLARRMLERDVRFVQIFHRGWDSHDGLPPKHIAQCRDIDQACYGLVTDLKQRGLLEDTLVIWGGEFGRSVYSQGPAGSFTETNYGRDHHPRCFSMWMAGAGIKPGIVHGETDEFSFNVVKDSVPLRDLHATVLQQFGLDHNRLTVRFQGLDQKLVGVDGPAQVVQGILR